MKIKYIISSFITLVLLLTGCEQELLNKVDPNTVSNTEFWKTENDFNTAIIAAYQPLQYTDVSGGLMTIYDRSRTDMSRSFYFYGTKWVYTTFQWSRSEPYIGDRWKGLYIGVNRTNQVIENLEETEANDDFTQPEIDLVKGQAHFLRGLYYFWLANSYGGAIIHTKTPVTPEEIQGSFSEYDEVINTVVIPDFKTAMTLLPETWGDSDKGRATSGAAQGFLGKVYLYMNEFDSAAVQFKSVIESGNYRLVSNIGENFSLAGENNEESLFEVSYSDVLLPGVHAANKEVLPNGDLAGQSTNKATHTATDKRGGLRSVVPTFWATELFLRDSVDVANPINDTNRYSKRAYWSVAFIGQEGDYYLQPTEEAANWWLGGAECAYWKKGSNWATKEDEDSWSNTNRSGINERMLRFADIKLMYAEALLRRPGSSVADFDIALQQVDDIRARAGVITLQDYAASSGDKIPILHRRGPSPYGSLYTPLNSASLLTHIQMVERPLELTYEGNSIRWHDLRRWGLIGQALNDVAAIDYKENWLIKWWNDGIVYPEDNTGLQWGIDQNQNHQAHNYDADVHDFFPVPIDEINSNKNIND